MSTTTHLRKTPTPKMLNALKNFHVPESEVSKMDFDTASARIKAEFAKLDEKKDTPNKETPAQALAEAARTATTQLTDENQRIEADLRTAFNLATKLVEEKYGEITPAELPLVTSLMDQFKGYKISEYIQKSKQSNMERISKERKGD